MKRDPASDAPDEPDGLRVIMVRLEKLRPHPSQKKYFGSFGGFEYQTLKTDIAANGQLVPIDVMPADNAAGLDPYTIISGHTRCKILIELGFEKGRVRIRHDLADASREEIDSMFLTDNIARRQLSKLARAKIALELYRLRLKTLEVNKSELLSREVIREEIAGIVDMKPRNMQRYFSLLEAPDAVHEAFEADRITLVDGSRFILLDEEAQDAILDQLNADPKRKVKIGSANGSKGMHKKPNDALATFVRNLVKGGVDLADRVDKVGLSVIEKHEQSLQDAKALIEQLLKKL